MIVFLLVVICVILVVICKLIRDCLQSLQSLWEAVFDIKSVFYSKLKNILQAIDVENCTEDPELSERYKTEYPGISQKLDKINERNEKLHKEIITIGQRINNFSEVLDLKNLSELVKWLNYWKQVIKKDIEGVNGRLDKLDGLDDLSNQLYTIKQHLSDIKFDVSCINNTITFRH